MLMHAGLMEMISGGQSMQIGPKINIVYHHYVADISVLWMRVHKRMALARR